MSDGYDFDLSSMLDKIDFSSPRDFPTAPLETLWAGTPGAGSGSYFFNQDTWAPVATDSGEWSWSNAADKASSIWDWLTKTGMSKEPVLDANGKVVGTKSTGMSPLGAGVSALAAFDQYRRQKQQAKQAKQLYDMQMQWAMDDRARRQAGQAARDVLNSPFDTQITNRAYIPVNNAMASRIGRLDKSTGQVYAPVMYDRSTPGVTIVPRDVVSAAANPLNKAEGGVIPRRGALGMVAGGAAGQSDTVPAKLSSGEYVMDADVVSALGDGNTEAGAKKLDEMRESVRQHKRSAPKGKIPPKAKSPLQYMKGAK